MEITFNTRTESYDDAARLRQAYGHGDETAHRNRRPSYMGKFALEPLPTGQAPAAANHQGAPHRSTPTAQPTTAPFTPQTINRS
ncbi:hypothetical protein ACWF9B_00320 [Streptomyces sp. NPDC055089]